MTDYSSDLKPLRRGHAPSVEYGVYFGLIFAISLPGAVLRSLAAATRLDFSGPGPLRRAQTRAREITPAIFDV
ncbi:cytochrome PufQ [Albimonas pacifica]|uniref:PufQ cytochrome subunit n=1 Tax=Albimonas pacifica TaxID=1114924 RepID=A0A1I3CNK9_9RHOB|nr:cytochrome PufQ [Albimonas pacifica]SFH75821.1 PufQ cytochrome subunit [Albimonas pacifica]